MSQVLRTALVAGGSGLVGTSVLRRLLNQPEYGRVISLGRRRLPIGDAALEQREVNFDTLQELDDLPPVDDVYCCLGTTLHLAGSRQAFRAVDLGYVRAVAALGRRFGANQFLLVSALGANPQSRFFYTRTKGEAEHAVAEAGYEAVHMFRPALLAGRRAQERPGERLAVLCARAVAPVLIGGLRRFRPIAAADVAAAMVAVALQDLAGCRVHESDAIAELAGRAAPGATPDRPPAR